MNDDPKIPVPRQIHRFTGSATERQTKWTPPPLPHLPDQRQRFSLYQRIDTAKRKAVDMEVFDLLTAFERTLQAISMTIKGAVPDTRTTDQPDATDHATRVAHATATQNATQEVAEKQATPLSSTERSRLRRKKLAEQALKGSEPRK